MTASGQELMAQADSLYELHGKPLEKEHWGEYVAIFPDGIWVLGASRLEALDRALAQLGAGSFVFKVGEKVVGRWRRSSATRS